MLVEERQIACPGVKVVGVADGKLAVGYLIDQARSLAARAARKLAAAGQIPCGEASASSIRLLAAVSANTVSNVRRHPRPRGRARRRWRSALRPESRVGVCSWAPRAAREEDCSGRRAGESATHGRAARRRRQAAATRRPKFRSFSEPFDVTKKYRRQEQTKESHSQHARNTAIATRLAHFRCRARLLSQSGITQMMNATEVIKMGRRRSRQRLDRGSIGANPSRRVRVQIPRSGWRSARAEFPTSTNEADLGEQFVLI